MNTPENLQGRANALRLYGLLAHWSDVAAEQWVAPLLQWEEDERARRSLERRIRDARLGNFKPLCDFDWSWPTRCDRLAVEELMSLGFVRDTANVVLIGPNGVGKSTLALNLAYQALAVVELIEDLRARICMHYDLALHDLLREQHSPPEDPNLNDISDPF